MTHNKLRNKLLIILLSVTLIPFLAIGITLYEHNSSSLTKAMRTKLETVRNLNKKALQRYFRYQHDLIEIISEDKTVKQSFQELYELQKRSKISDNARFPFQSKDVQQIYKKYDDYINWYIHKHQFLDLYYIEASSGQVIYTAMKHSDIGVNLKVGSQKKSALAWSFYNAVRNRKVSFEDMYASEDKTEDPTMLMSMPVMNDGSVIGVIVLKFGFEKVNEIMNSHLGESKEEGVYLVGEDNRLRSSSSFEPISMSIKQSFSNVKEGFVNSVSIQKALNGQEGSHTIALADHYKVLSSYTPIYIYGTTWAIISESLVDTIDDALRSMFWIIVLVFLVLTAIMIGLAYYFQGRLHRASQKHIDALSYTNQSIGSYIDSIGLSLNLLSNRAEDQSLLTDDAISRFKSTLENVRKATDVIKVSRILGKKVDEGLHEGDKKIAKTLWQLNKIGEATKELKILVERIHAISLETNIISLDSDNHSQESEAFSEMAQKIKTLSQQMIQVASYLQDFIVDTTQQIDESKMISKNIGELFEAMQDHIYKSNQLIKKYAMTHEKSIVSYQQYLHSLQGSDTISDENAIASKQLALEMQELHEWNHMMYNDIVKISQAIGLGINETRHEAGLLNMKELPLIEEEINLPSLHNDLKIEHELSKL